MDKPKKEEPPRFQMTPQVAVIVLVTMLAMALPLFGVASMLRGYLEARRVSPTEKIEHKEAAENPALRAALEKAAGTLGVEPISDERASLIVAVAEVERDRQGRALKDLAAKLGGSAVEVETSRRFLVSVPTREGFEAIRKSLGSAVTSRGAMPQTGGFFEVQFQ